jgi:hypothetical protein
MIGREAPPVKHFFLKKNRERIPRSPKTKKKAFELGGDTRKKSPF